MGEAAARWLLSNLPSESLIKLAHAIKELEGAHVLSGFRISLAALEKKTVRQAIIERIFPLFKSSSRLPGLVFLSSFPDARWFKWAEAISVLDEEWFVSNWRNVLRATADPALGIAMALDHRERIAGRGTRLLKGNFLWTVDPMFMAGDMPTAMRELLALLSAAGDTSASSGLGRTEREVVQIKAELRKSEKARKRLQRETEHLELELSRAREQVNELRDAIVKAKMEGEEKSRLIKELQDGLDRQVELKVKRILSQFFPEGLPEETLWADSLEGNVTALLDRAEKALSAQRQLDVRYGTRSSIRSAIEQLESKLGEIRKAEMDSLAPSSGLIRIRKELENEILRLKVMLPDLDGVSTPFIYRILEYAAETQISESGLQELNSMIENLRREPYSRMLSDSEQDFLHEKMLSLLREREILVQSSMLSDASPRPGAEDGGREIANLSGFVVKNADLCKQSILLVDGYNVIKSSPQWAKRDRADFSKTRSEFCALWERKSLDWKEVELVFDGKENQAVIDRKGNLSVIFTDAKHSSQRADIYIRLRAEEIKLREGDSIVFLMTADMALRKSLEGLCDYFIDPRWSIITYLAI